MAYREKVIQAMEWCQENACEGCLYDTHNNESCGISDDILALLKEQDAKEGHWIVLEFCANEGIYCSECHMKIFDRITKPKKKLSQYCPHCGSKNEQFFRDGEVVFR